MSIPLVQNNEKDSINTSIIAIKRNIERINMLLGLSNSEEIDTSEFVKKSDIVDVVEAGNMNPVTSNAVVPVDEVTSGNMQSVSSNAVADKFNGLIKTIEKNYGTVTVSSSNYLLLDNSVTNKEVIGYKVTSWSANSGCFSIYTYGIYNQVYLVANNGVTVRDLKVKFFYLDI